MTISATTFTHQRYLGPVQDWPLVAIHSVLLLKNDEIIAKTDVPSLSKRKLSPATMFLTDTKFLRFKVFKKLSFPATWQSERTDF